jgi:chorismate mutase
MNNIINISSSRQAFLELFDFGKETTADINKKLLLKIAKNGKDKPSCKTKLGRVLYNYTRKSSSSYDPVFDKQIRKLRPDWFVSTANQNKKLLLKIAKNGKDRPHWKSKLGWALYNYTRKSSSSYDPVFDKQIRKLRPDWFVSTSKQNKKLLLEMAKNGKDKPILRSKLGAALYNYTYKSSSSYDPVFDKQIRKLRPDWFRK